MHEIKLDAPAIAIAIAPAVQCNKVISNNIHAVTDSINLKRFFLIVVQSNGIPYQLHATKQFEAIAVLFFV